MLNVLTELDALSPYVQTQFSFGGFRKRRMLDPSNEDDGLAAVPAAIRCVLNEIEKGAEFVACADIRSFFTRIPKPLVTAIIASAANDSEFVSFFESAIHVELSNMAQLRERAREFPIEEIGVAQGNSLSPLLGNIVLAHFDEVMNQKDCRCIRYIDDFMILGRSSQAVNRQLREARRLLSELGMELSAEKSAAGAHSIRSGFDFLGINVMPGLIRPSAKAQKNLLRCIGEAITESRRSYEALRNGTQLNRAHSLADTLKRVSGIVDGWGKHYWFCNDSRTLEHLDDKIDKMVSEFLGAYSDTRGRVNEKHHRSLLGISLLAEIGRSPFAYPRRQSSTTSKRGVAA